MLKPVPTNNNYEYQKKTKLSENFVHFLSDYHENGYKTYYMYITY